jgi:hypothetical protein
LSQEKTVTRPWSLVIRFAPRMETAYGLRASYFRVKSEITHMIIVAAMLNTRQVTIGK